MLVYLDGAAAAGAEAPPESRGAFLSSSSFLLSLPLSLSLVAEALRSIGQGEVTTKSGLKLQRVVSTTGPSPTISSSVRVHYEGKLENGTVFDSSIARGQPIDFPLSGVIKGWTEGLQLMRVGETAILTIPSDLGYGDSGQGPIPPRATLIFEVRLIAIV